MNLTSRFTEEMVSLAKSYCDDPDEAAAAFRGGSFAEHAVIYHTRFGPLRAVHHHSKPDASSETTLCPFSPNAVAC
jgi:hypothetical protein